jgi:antitoxin MazE
MPALKKWGNSLALRIPAPLARQLNLTENTSVECAVVDGNLLISRVIEPRPYSLNQLLGQVTPENIHDETAVGGPAGKEIW